MTAHLQLPTVAILAGGLATRLRPLTETIPKSLIEINGEPFIAHQLRLLRKQGIQRVVICTGYLAEMIQNFLGDGKQFGIEVDYSLDGPQLLGTGGALKRALPKLGEEFFVLYGDSYLTCDYRAVYQSFLLSHKQGLMTVLRNDNQWDTSNVEYAKGQILVYDKKNRTEHMHHIDYGLGMFKQSAFATVPEDTPIDLATIYASLLQQHQLTAFEVTERFYEIGSHAGIAELSEFLARKTTYEQTI